MKRCVHFLNCELLFGDILPEDNILQDLKENLKEKKQMLKDKMFWRILKDNLKNQET